MYLYTDTPQDSEVEMRIEMKRLRERMKVPTLLLYVSPHTTIYYYIHHYMCPRTTRGGDAHGDIKRLRHAGAHAATAIYLSSYD